MPESVEIVTAEAETRAFIGMVLPTGSPTSKMVGV